MNKHVELFDRIAFIYQWFFQLQVKSYQKTIQKYEKHLKISPGDKVLDLGCGTGAFTYSLQNLGYSVTGVDASPAMVKKGQKNNINCVQSNIIKELDFPDDSFDLVTAAYVAHGLTKSNRKKLYRESQRLTKDRVIFHDYKQKDHLLFYLINLVEYLEGGDYFSFRENAVTEMGKIFNNVEIIDIGLWSNWYICS